MNNHDFNIINQLIQEQKSLWRIENHYIEDSATETEAEFWKKMRDQKITTIEELSKMSAKSL